MDNRWTIPYLALGLALLAAGCGSAQPSQSIEDQAVATQVASSNESAPFDVSALTTVVYLAVEVEISVDGIKPINVNIVRGPQKANSALGDLQVSAFENDKVILEYTAADPRLVEIDGQRQTMQEKGRTIFYVPLSTSLTTLQVKPSVGREKLAVIRSKIDLRPWMRQGCLKSTGLDVCKAVLERIQGAHVVLGGKLLETPQIQQAIISSVPWAELAGKVIPETVTPIIIEQWRGATLESNAEKTTFDFERARRLLDQAGAGKLSVTILYAEEDAQLESTAKDLSQAMGNLNIQASSVKITLSGAPAKMADLITSGNLVIWLTW